MAQNSSRSSSVSSSSGGETDCRYKRIKLDPSELDGSPSSTEATLTQPTLPANMKTQAAFVNKLYKMLEDPDTSELISWSSHGDLFSVSNPTSFSKTVLPQYFKHNNWQSFVRQLNMYGFHKVNDLIHSNLTNENQTWEFKHPNFRKGAVGDLQHIKRKSAKTQLQASPQFNFNSNESSYTPPSKADEQQQQQQNQQQNQQQQNQNQQQQNQNQQQQNQNQQQQNHNQQQYQQQQQHQQHQQDMSNGDNNNNSPVIKHILRIEEHLLGVTKSCESLFNEVVHLRMVVSKQQDAMQDLVDVVSSTKSNNNCICSNNNNPNHSMYNDNNNQELQNAENLRIQVSKLKESRQSRKSPSADSQSSGSMKNGTSTNATTATTTNWSQTTTASPSVNNNNNNNHNNNNNNNEKPNDTKQRKLPSFDSIRQQQRQSSYRLDATREDDKTSFDRKSSTCSSSSSSSSVAVPKYTNTDDSKNRSTMMGFGKQSHMLNPIHEQNRRKS
ncbi:HSF-type DNA-binding-domain-containing protein [Mucor mucedo]|uniref:HSF-type DNA-binding-domain-containing protein n=1 Tax=Mucor mucedo TaxID=29922 RepID=UPI002220A858|nr:HSF-type DNA-binding-domain-containing protein [Mucor mucedo]KAI7891827.1 HSF-type DNA-binding-domain-containing protein [Mucor mucedo]